MQRPINLHNNIKKINLSKCLYPKDCILTQEMNNLRQTNNGFPYFKIMIHNIETKQCSSSNIPSVVPKVGSGEGRMYTDLIPYLCGDIDIVSK